jgi:predicted transcriptional regulator
MPISIRLKPDIEQLLDQRARREHKTRTDLIHEALVAWLKPASPGLGSAIREALVDAPDGFGIERSQPPESDPRDWRR